MITCACWSPPGGDGQRDHMEVPLVRPERRQQRRRVLFGGPHEQRAAGRHRCPILCFAVFLLMPLALVLASHTCTWRPLQYLAGVEVPPLGWRLVQSDPHPFETRHRNTMPHSVRLFSVRVSMFHLMRRLQDGTHRQEHALAHCVEGHLRWPQPQRLPRPRVGAHTDLWSRALVFSSLALSCLPLSCLRLLLSFAVSATLPGQCTACCLHLQCGCRSRAAGVSGTFLSCRSRRRPLAPATTRSATAC